MKNILEVIIAAKDQQPVSDDELRLTVVALSAMLSLAERSGRELADAVQQGKWNAGLRAAYFRRDDEVRFTSRKMTPADYLGASHTPGTPENDKLKSLAAKVFEKATGQKL